MNRHTVAPAGPRHWTARGNGKNTSDKPRRIYPRKATPMTSSPALQRDASLQRIERFRQPWDIAAVGGGSTGIGIAVDAVTRGYSVVLLEQHDFGKGTSS